MSKVSELTALTSLTSGDYFLVIDDTSGDSRKVSWPNIESSISQVNDLTLNPSSSISPANNGELVIEATSNTLLTFKFKGSDGTVRSGTLTLS